jgi:uncharacterized protein YdaU (DUF1376 family)
MHYYSFHPGDYIAHTPHLTNEEDYAHRRAIDLYIQTEAPLANAKRSLSRRLRVDERSLQTVLDEFFYLTDEGWRNKRCDEEIAKFHSKADKAREAGRRGGQAKSSDASKRQADAKRTLSERQANQEPITNNHKPMNGDAGASKSAASKPKRELKAQPIDDDYLAKLQSEYPHAKVSEQFANCTKWWLERKKVYPSRRALVNWLDKVQPPPSASASLINSGLGDRCSVL